MVQPGTPAIAYEILPDPSAADWAAIEAVIAQSFPPEDRDPLEALQGWVVRGEMILAVARARQEAGRVIGLGTLEHLGPWDGYFLGYLAVTPEWRGQGVGEGLFRRLVDFIREAGVHSLIWEVHPPDPADPGALDSRRVRFYERLGGRLIPGTEPYVLPNLIGPGYFPYRLMWLTADPAEPDPAPAVLADLVRAVYRREYPGHEAMGEQIAAAILAASCDASSSSLPTG